ncbi:zinc finger BED domain-containing protein 1-like [Sparus aurata]|uniref:zinc finger BED domain-containing protein 1-like n=1 Tax=Sparus aurata TaxID=8175 RepID=UPI0011C0E57D|nr:zinc finger BED domain-containing protein 1-like [Sparus aurata]
MFLEEATSLDPRFKTKILGAAVWSRLVEKACGENSEQHALEMYEEEEENKLDKGMEEELGDEETASLDDTTHIAVTTSHSMCHSALGELFAEEDLALKTNQAAPLLDLSEKARKELELYRALPPELTSTNPAEWWWERRGTFPILFNPASNYTCVQASSTPAERIFSTAGDTISQGLPFAREGRHANISEKKLLINED